MAEHRLTPEEIQRQLDVADLIQDGAPGDHVDETEDDPKNPEPVQPDETTETPNPASRPKGLRGALSDYRDHRKTQRDQMRHTLAYLHHKVHETRELDHMPGVPSQVPQDALTKGGRRMAVWKTYLKVVTGDLLPSEASQEVLKIKTQPVDYASRDVKELKIGPHLDEHRDIYNQQLNARIASQDAINRIIDARKENQEEDATPAQRPPRRTIPTNKHYEEHLKPENVQQLGRAIRVTIAQAAVSEASAQGQDRLSEEEFQSLSRKIREQIVHSYIGQNAPRDVVARLYAALRDASERDKQDGDRD